MSKDNTDLLNIQALAEELAKAISKFCEPNPDPWLKATHAKHCVYTNMAWVVLDQTEHKVKLGECVLGGGRSGEEWMLKSWLIPLREKRVAQEPKWEKVGPNGTRKPTRLRHKVTGEMCDEHSFELVHLVDQPDETVYEELT